MHRKDRGVEHPPPDPHDPPGPTLLDPDSAGPTSTSPTPRSDPSVTSTPGVRRRGGWVGERRGRTGGVPPGGEGRLEDRTGAGAVDGGEKDRGQTEKRGGSGGSSPKTFTSFSLSRSHNGPGHSPPSPVARETGRDVLWAGTLSERRLRATVPGRQDLQKTRTVTERDGWNLGVPRETHDDVQPRL